jgi:lysine-N-methylase
LRPILAPDAFVRTYLGEGGRFWVLVRGPGRTRLRIDAETRALLDLCDGGRRSAQIAREAQVPRLLGAIDVERKLLPLVREGVMRDLDAPPPLASTAPPREIGLELSLLDDETLARLELVPAPGVGLGCHGKGGCCRLYDRLRLDSDEVARIAAAYGDEPTPGGLSVDSAVMRERADEEVFGLAVSGGGCVLLEADGACGVHRRLGADGKPSGCRAYPLRDVKCGDQLHVALAVECRCTVDFAGGDRGMLLAECDSLFARRKHTRIVEEVKPAVTLNATVSRADYLAWRAEATARLSRSDDVLRWALAALPEVAPPGDFIDPLQRWLMFESADLGRLYDSGDLQRRLLEWADAAAARLHQPHPPVEGERLAAEQLLFGHGFLRHADVSIALTAFALRILLARAGAALPLPPELLPMVSVEYLGRVYGLGRIFD